MKDPALWQRLQAHRFDAPGATQPFSVKLALAEGWDQAHTAAVIEEYRRFLYLTQIADGQVTPSIAVDRAWHMHLTFTRDYWEQLCPHVLGQKLHHEPCSGPEEMPRYDRQFETTRALYQAEFGTPPPRAVWGPQPERTPAPKRALAGAGVCGISAGAVLLFMDTGVLVALGVILFSIAVIVIDARRRARPARKRRKDGGGGAGAGGCGGGGGWFGGKSGDGGSDGGGGGGGCGGGGCGS